MHNIRSALTAASLVALVAISSPAGAADTKATLAIVNGNPGQRVDVCLNGREVVSKLPYGKTWMRAALGTGQRSLKVFEPDRRECRGRLLAKRAFSLGPADDLTIVITRRSPKIVAFDNVGLGEIPPLGAPTFHAPFAVRHAAEVAADISYDYWNGPPFEIPVIPSGIFIKGQEWRADDEDSGLLKDFAFEFRAQLLGSAVPLVSPITRAVQSHRLEWILVGTNRADARWVHIDRLVSQTTP